MLSALREFFEAMRPSGGIDVMADALHRLELAVAVLLVEVMRAEPAIDESERRAVIAALRSEFALADDEVEPLLQRAMQASRDATDYYEFTSQINESFDMPRKLTLIEHLWRVVYADGHLGAHENHVMRKLADLLYIPQGAYVLAKTRARQASQQAEPGVGPILPTGETPAA